MFLCAIELKASFKNQEQLVFGKEFECSAKLEGVRDRSIRFGSQINPEVFDHCTPRQPDLGVRSVHRAKCEFRVRFIGKANLGRRVAPTGERVLDVAVGYCAEGGAKVLVKLRPLIRVGYA